MKRLLCLVLTLALCLGGVMSASADIVPGDSAARFGDVNGDLQQNAVDALAVLKNAVGKQPFDATQTVLADVNGDGEIDAKDALEILKFAVGSQTSFKVGDYYDAYALDTTDYADPDTTYQAYENSDFAYNTSLSVNGAYAVDTTADNSFVMDNTGLEPNTMYLATSVLTGAKNNDYNRLFFSFQGLLNRDYGRDANHTSILFMNSDGSDGSWREYILEEGSVFYGMQVVRIQNWEEFFTVFDAQLKQCGYILWDGNVPATSNVAATICGVDGYLPVLANSPLHEDIKTRGYTQKQSLVGLFKDGQKGQKIADSNAVSSGSAKNDAYRWALDQYFDRCSSNYLAYILDGASLINGYDAYEDNPMSLIGGNAQSVCLSNHDYLIARRCFFFDLAPYKNEAACDDPAQQEYCKTPCTKCGVKGSYTWDELMADEDPICEACGQQFTVEDWEGVEYVRDAEKGVDNETMLMIFDARYQRAKGAMGQMMGFPPWWVKYTQTNGHGSQAATWIEWLFCEYITCYNMAKEADAAAPSSMTNGSVFYKYVPKTASYDNQWEEYDSGVTYNEDTLYYTIYMGDYDSSAWLKEYVHQFFIKKDNARGDLPLTWCFNPNLSNRVPMIFDYVYENKFDNEFIAAGDSGAGYVIPAGLFGDRMLSYSVTTRPEGYENGDAAWAGYCKKFYTRFDMKATGFIINGSNGMNTDILGMYNTFSTMGGLHNSGGALMTNYKGVPYVYCQNGIGTDTDLSVLYEHAFTRMAGYNFAAYRTVCKSPTQIRSIVKKFNEYAAEKGQKVQYVELYTFLSLAAQSGQGAVVK